MRSALLIVLLFTALHALAGQALTEVEAFGGNPGNLRMFFHLPANAAKKKMPLVIVLHGCTQSAERIATLSGWNELADHAGFFVLYPEQRGSNNGASCFNWFKPEEIVPGQGEVASIHNMVVHALAHWPVDPERIFIYGVSAGGGMAAAMMACHPELVQAGAIIAGAPYRAAKDTEYGRLAIHDPKDRTPAEWGALITSMHPAGTHYPRVIVIHGTSDDVVDIRHADALIAQWTSAHGCDSVPDSAHFDLHGTKGLRQSTYRNEAGTVLTFYRIEGLGHKLPVDPGPPPRQGGKTTWGSPNIGWHSTYAVAKDFGVVE